MDDWMEERIEWMVMVCLSSSGPGTSGEGLFLSGSGVSAGVGAAQCSLSQRTGPVCAVTWSEGLSLFLFLSVLPTDCGRH